MMRQILRGSFLLLVACTGCFGFEARHSSEPLIPGAKTEFQRYVGDMFVLPEIAFHLYPGNRETSGMPFPIPPPPPQCAPAAQHPPFHVEVAFRPSLNGFTFDPTRVDLEIPGMPKTRPDALRGPYDCSAVSGVPTDYSRLPSAALPLKTGVTTCMWLEFQVPTPCPQQRFAIQLGGLALSGVDYALPKVDFRELRGFGTFAIP